MIDRRIRAAFRKYKLTGFAFISALGLTSVFAVNLAGFLVMLPRPFWGLLDAYFFSSYFIRLSILLAFSILASRYSVYVASALLGFIYRVILLTYLLTKKAGRRLIRIKGCEGTAYMARILLRHHDNEIKNGDKKSKFEEMAQKIYHSNFAKSAFGLFYTMGQAQGSADGRIGHFTIPIQLMALIVVLSALFTTIKGSIFLVALAIFIFFVLPPENGGAKVGHGSGGMSLLRAA